MQNAVTLRADDRVANPWLAWIVLRGQHHRHGRAVAPLQLTEACQRAGRRGVEQLAKW